MEKDNEKICLEIKRRKERMIKKKKVNTLIKKRINKPILLIKCCRIFSFLSSYKQTITYLNII